jgi:hypothetical protein
VNYPHTLLKLMSAPSTARVMNSEKKLIKILVRLRIDSDDYPPVSYESLWATLNPDDTCTIDNTPYYVYGLSKGDSVSVKFEDGERYADTITSKGGHSTLRVFSSNKDESMEIIDFIKKNGGNCSKSHGLSLFSVDIPATCSFEVIDDYLSNIQNDDTIAFEDACLQHANIPQDRRLECLSLATLVETPAKTKLTQ